MTAERTADAVSREDFWSRSLRAWDMAFYLMVTIAAVALLLADLPARTLVVVLGALTLLVAAYLGVGRRSARAGHPRRVEAYLVALIVLSTTIVWFTPTGTILLFIAYSHIWFFTETRVRGIVACTALTIGVFAALSRHHGPGSDLVGGLLAQGGLSLAFAVLLGLWITHIAEQSEERAELIARLRAAQDELGRSHHAAGVGAERERMAQEIHDTLAQGFTSIIMLTQTASADLTRGEAGRAAERIDLAERTARENLAEARALVAAFAPVDLDGSTLGEALGRLARRFAEETGVRVDVVLPSSGTAVPLARDREVILLRAAQEALSNVRRHAQAGHVQLVLATGPPAGAVPGPAPDDRCGAAARADEGASAEEGTVRLEVVDDGRGLDPAAAEGFGLRGMRERVTSGGGELAVSSPADGGTRVRVTLPTGTDVPPAVVR